MTNNRPLIVGLNSRRGKTGKDTIAASAMFTLSQSYAKLSMPPIEVTSAKSVRFAFGDILKDECTTAICGFSPSTHESIRKSMDDQSRKDVAIASLRINQMPNGGYRDWLYEHTDFDRKVSRSPRFHMQQFGNGFVRNYHNTEDAWLNAVKTQVSALRGVDVVFITDMRQPNEANWVRDSGGITIFVSRDWEEPDIDHTEIHETDTALHGWQFDHYLLNEHGKALEVSQKLTNIIREKLDERN